MSDNLLDQTLMKIDNFIDKICSFNVIDFRDEYMETNTLIFDCLYSPPSSTTVLKNYSGHRYDSSDDWHFIVGDNLYHHVETCLQNKLKNICHSVTDIPKKCVLQLYVRYWKAYKFCCRALNGCFHYFNQHWVQYYRNSGEDNIYEIGVLSQQIWEDYFFKPLFPCVTQTCLNLIRMHRINKNSSIDIQPIKDIIQLYLNHNFNEKIMKNDSTIVSINDIYEEYFESEFLQDVEDFYRQRNSLPRESKPMIKYLNQVVEYIDQEINLAKSYLPESKSTLQRLNDKLEEIFISDHNLNIIMINIKLLVSTENKQGDMSTDIALLYEPISRIPKIKNELIKFIENYIYENGIEAIERITTTAMNDFGLYIEEIYKIYQKYFTLLQKTNKTDSALITSLNKACRKFVNNNSLTQTIGDTTQIPKRLALHCDALLKNGILEEKFNQMMIVFTYVNDKDIFLKFYQKMLTKRFVDQSSILDDEKLMISKLNQICPCEHTLKLERMYQDILVSKNLTEEFCKTHHLVGIVDFSIMVLTSNSWSFSALSNIVLPIELKPTFDSFTEFYTHRYNKRKLTWLHQHSKGELQTFFTSQKYILQVSTYQMVVLLLFNKDLTWTVERIQDETQIEFELIIQILYSLLKSKILVCDEINEDFKEIDIKMNHLIRLATDFTSKKVQININVPLKSIEKKDTKGLDKTINEDRQMFIQATIVRIMKSQQTLKYNLLIDKIIQQMSIYSQPKIPLIKKCIDILIEKEYIERDTNEKDRLNYLA